MCVRVCVRVRLHPPVRGPCHAWGCSTNIDQLAHLDLVSPGHELHVERAGDVECFAHRLPDVLHSPSRFLAKRVVWCREVWHGRVGPYQVQ